MSDTIQLRYRVEGMDCPSCAGKIETALSRLPGVADVKVAYASQALSVGVANRDMAGAAIEKTVRSLGYVATLRSSDGLTEGRASAPGRRSTVAHARVDDPTGREKADIDPPLWKTRKARLVAGIGALIVIAYVTTLAFPGAERWAYGVAVVTGLVPFAHRAWMQARLGSPFSIETLMVVASVGALAIGESAEAAIVVFLFAVGELLENVAAGRARSGIKSLIGLVPRTAFVEDAGQTREVPITELAIGQTVLVRPGERVPTDGEIVAGASSLDESPITGESTPVTRDVGGPVFAGSINLTAALRIRVAKVAADNTIARIVRLVEEAQENQAPTARFIDRFSRWYTPAAMIVSALTILVPPLAFDADWYTWTYRGLALLLIACPCALVLSTPAAIASALAAGTRKGLLVKGGAALETIGKATTVAFDKTGTLTEGKPQVTDVVALSGDPNDALVLAAAIEAGSSHPIGKAILAEAATRELSVPPAKASAAIAGKAVEGMVGTRHIVVGSPRYAEELGVVDEKTSQILENLEAAGKTAVVVIEGNTARAVIAVRDEPRQDARAGVAALHALGVRTIMLTGDNRRTGAAIAGAIGLDVNSELLPEDKLGEIGRLKADGPVAMVGDGINDAPALAAASVGIAMGGGTDVALETADAALMKSRVGGVAELIRLSRATIANIKENIAVSIGLKVVFLATTLTGTTTMWMAILADTGATVLVTLNALRLLRYRS